MTLKITQSTNLDINQLIQYQQPIRRETKVTSENDVQENLHI